MACAQQIKSSQDIQLLPNQVLSDQQSLIVMKKLLAIAVSGITYLRGLFPENAYGSKYVADQKVMILKEELSCPGASQMVQWMQGCFDAIEKKYLRVVILSIFTDPDKPQKVTEYYQFKIRYTGKGAQMDFESSDNNKQVSSMACGNTKKASTLLVRKLYTLMQNLGPLPDSVCLNMKLAYYDNVTPQGYQPPGFKEADGDTLMFEKEPVKLTMGEVVTPFHCLKMDMATERQRLEQVEESVTVMEKWVVKVDEVEDEEVNMSQTVIEDMMKSDTQPDNNNNNNNSQIQLSCDEKMDNCEENIVLSQTDTSVMKISDVMKTRSGRTFKSTTVTDLTVSSEAVKAVKSLKDKQVCHFEIFNSQETPSSTAPIKKRKFSEPKERY